MPGLFDSQTLLSPQEEGFARSQGMMNAAAALMKGAEYSVIPKSTLAAIGDGLQGYTSGYNGASDQMLKRELLHGQIDQKRLAALQMIAQYAGLGIEPPPLLKQMAGGAGAIGNFGNVGAGGGGGAAPGLPAPASGMPAAGGAPAAPMQVAGPGAPPSAIPAGLLSPNLVGNASPLSGGAPAPAPTAPQATAPGAGGGVGIPDVANIIRTLPLQSRYALATKSPAGEIVKDVLGKTLTPTDDQKNAAASGVNSPLDYKAGVKNAQLTPEMKNAAAAGFGNDLAGYNSWLKQTEGLAAEKAKHVGTYIQGISPAKQSIDTLNTMEDALDRAGDKITTGPYANEMLKLKQFAQNAGVKVEGLPEAEVVSKLNAYLAGQATKAISSRPAQFEFQTYLKNNPGLLNSVDGTKKLIDVLRQQQTHALDLGQMALDEKNLKNWGDVEKNYYKTHPVVSPFSNLPLGGTPKLPAGSQFNRKLMQYRDPQGNLYDAAGNKQTPGKQSDAGTFQVADAGGRSIPPIEIENLLTQHSQGRLSNGQVRQQLPAGWSIDFRGRNDAYKVYGPDGVLHHIFGGADGAPAVG